MQKIHKFVSALAISGFAAAGVSAATIDIDFGRNDAGQESGAGWNNVSADVGNQATNVTQILNLVDSANAGTGINLDIAYTVPGGGLSASGGGADYAGPYPAAVGGFDASAISDSFFISGSTGEMEMTFSGLNANATYEFLFYGARGNNGGAASYAVTGANSDTVSIAEVLNNSGSAPSTVAITPDGSDSIVVSWTAPSGVGALSMISITETVVPEPGSLALLGLGGLALIRRRR